MRPSTLQKTGVYLFRPPAVITTSLDRELLVLFCSRFPKVTGAVFYRPTSDGSQDITSMLDQLLEQMRELDIFPSSLQVKICGMSRNELPTVQRILRWMNARSLNVVAIDVGKHLKREIRIIPEEARLGIRHVETRYRDLKPFWAPGSHGDRVPQEPATDSRRARSRERRA